MTFRRKGISRRDFIKYSMAAGAAAAIPWRMALAQAVTGPYGISSPNLTKFGGANPLNPAYSMRGIGGTGIPVAASDGAGLGGSTHYTIQINGYTDLLHPELPPTRLWGYGQVGVNKHLGGIIVAQRGVPVQITFQNNLPPGQIIPNDPTIPQPAGNKWNRTAVHLHGGLVPWISDGGPHAWWAPDGSHGASFIQNATLKPGVLPGSTTAALNEAEYFYPNNQSARLEWYHDHAWGITRTNAYAGIASGYVIQDLAGEAAFQALNAGVPSALDLSPATLNRTFHYLIFQDKIFFGAGGSPGMNPVYPLIAGPGDLFYAYNYNPALFGPAGIPSFGGGIASPFPLPSCVPEFFGDTILVNGTAYPVLEVEARPIRFRMLNSCGARFLNPRLVATSGNIFPDSAEPKVNALGPGFIQIGTEGGYLPQATPVGGKNMPQLLLSPAERADLICDFTGILAGTEFILYSDAPGPYPGGAGIFDFYPKNPKTPTSIPGFGPNTRTLLKIRVKAVPLGTTVTPLPVTINMAATNLSEPLLVAQTPGVPTPIPASVFVRTLTLNEGFDKYGRLAQYLGTNLSDSTAPLAPVPGFFGREYERPATEVIPAGTKEVWQIANLTLDTHPIHFHLVNVQILYRQAIKTKGFVGTFTINPNGQPVAPDFNELGYKETVRMNPGEVTTVIMKFDLPTGLPFTVPPSPRTGGNEYVWHCHILEHEEHDMMRPLVVI